MFIRPVFLLVFLRSRFHLGHQLTDQTLDFLPEFIFQVVIGYLDAITILSLFLFECLKAVDHMFVHICFHLIRNLYGILVLSILS